MDNVYYTYDSTGHLVSMNLNGVEYYYIRNAQGDIIGLFDSTGEQVVSYTYDSWGKPFPEEKDTNGNILPTSGITGSLASTVGVKNPYRYRGYRYDTETGLYYLQSRYYNAEWGRFINSDGTLGSPGELLGANMFTYCKNNPVNMSDEDGDRPTFDSEEVQADYDIWLYNQQSEAAAQFTNAQMNELGANWYYRREKSKTSNTGETDHLQLRGPGGIEIGQNTDGKPHPSVQPSPPGWVKKELKKREGWDWDAKNKEYQEKQSENSNKVKKTVAGGVVMVGGGYVVYRVVRFLPSLLPPLWPTIPANALCP